LGNTKGSPAMNAEREREREREASRDSDEL